MTNFDKFLLIRPNLGDYQEDEYHMPIVKSANISNINWSDVEVTNYNNLKPYDNLNNVISLMFKYDTSLMSLWNNPFKMIPLFQRCLLCATPDFSVHPKMNENEIRHMIYMKNWLGCLWNHYGCNMIQTASWATSDTYDICFSGIENNSPVVISTIGCKNNTEMFLQGFYALKEKKNPSLFIVYGDFIQGMTGKFVHYQYQDAFSLSSPKQLSLLKGNVFEIKEAV